MTTLKIPKLSLVVLVGPSGSGKSTFAARHFKPTEVLSSDVCRGWVRDDPDDQSATADAFDVLNYVAGKRLAAGLLTVVDATNVQKEARRSLIRLARQHDVLPVAIVLDVPPAVCHARNADRPDRTFGPHVVRNQLSQMRRGLRGLKREGFRQTFVLDGARAIDDATIDRVPLWNDRTELAGPFDIIGDVHGCADELDALLVALGYQPYAPEDVRPGRVPVSYAHPDGRTAVFVGDLVDRGPASVRVLSVAMNMVRDGHALAVPGNHDVKLMRAMRGKNVAVRYGLAETLADIDRIDDDDARQTFRRDVADFVDSLVSHLVLDGGRLVVAHAGMKAAYQGRASGRVREFALYGETTGEFDADGLPRRIDWAAEYRGDARVAYGHTPVADAVWRNRTINLDTGCVFGGSLTALRYPELETVGVPATRVHCRPARPIDGLDPVSGRRIADDALDAGDVLGKQVVDTRLRKNITIRGENAAAAMEVMSRFAVDPAWLPYLPPTMSPPETSTRDGFLEHPEDVFDYFRGVGVDRVVCQEKHMGSRAVVVVARDAAAAADRFGGGDDRAGVVVTRTGRPFFDDASTEAAIIDRLNRQLNRSGFYERLGTTWAIVDAELMPWSAKASELLRSQYAAVGAAGRASLPAADDALKRAIDRLGDSEDAAAAIGVREAIATTAANLSRFTDAYRKYCWDVDTIDDYRLAPFHVLATEGRVHVDRDHDWHIDEIDRWCDDDDPVVMRTRRRSVRLDDAESVAEAIDWWSKMTAAGGEGMVVKPHSFVATGRKGLVQPAMKCRGREYLRIIYGPDYDTPTNLGRLRRRGVGRKRSLALREFALGVEALERFVRREPLRRVHQCVFGVLALESEPVDPRL